MASPATLIDVVRERALRQPERTAYVFLADGEAADASISYGELNRQAQAVGALLQAEGMKGERVLLLYPPGLNYIAAFLGCLYAGAVAVPAYPPRLNQSLGRLQAIVADAQAALTLTTTAVLNRTEQLFDQTPYLKKLRWVTTDTVDVEMTARWREPEIDGDALALLQYTSGSVSAPKGVMVSHANLMHNERVIKTLFRMTEDSIIVGWLPLFHDMGLIGNVLQPLYVGAACILMPPMAFLQRPYRWLQAISRYQATTSGGPNFAYDLCVRKIDDAQKATLDLSHWQLAFNGSEPVRAETINRFTAAFAGCGFRRESFHPCYGLAEATLMVTGKLKPLPPIVKTIQARALETGRVVEVSADAENSLSLVGCGEALCEQKIVIVNPETLNECAEGCVGEIWLSGPSVARGYWNRTTETALTFSARLSHNSETAFLRTGDLGLMIDGELFVTGRLKDLIIIRGVNYYPQDIEETAEQSHAALRPHCGAAFSVDVAGEERLVLVEEIRSRQSVNFDEVTRAVRHAVAEKHEIQVYAVVLIKPGGLPKTTSGKIQRQACRKMFLENELPGINVWQEQTSTAVWTPAPELAATAIRTKEEIEAWLKTQLAAQLKSKPELIESNAPVSRYGLDSLRAIELMHSIEASLGVSLPVTCFLENPTLAELAAQVHAELSALPEPSSSTPDTSDEASIVSYGERALWFLHQLAPQSAAYNIAGAVRLRGELDAGALRRALQALVERHSSLRSTFKARHGEPSRQIQERLDVERFFREEDAATWSEASLHERLNEESARPFDLGSGPLLRVTLYGRPSQGNVLLLVVHHIIADFWSLAIVARELGDLYTREKNGESRSLRKLNSRYSDYAQWQSQMLESAAGESLWSYWREQLSGKLPALELYHDHDAPPPPHASHGEAHEFKLSRERTRQLLALSQEQGATLYMTLLAAFQVLLHRHTGQDDFLIGSPTAGRHSAAFADVVGYFVNMLVLRTDLSGDPTFVTLLSRVRRTVPMALKYQDYPFALLVEHLQPERGPAQAPLIQVAFAMQKSHRAGEESLAALPLGQEGIHIELGDLKLESLKLRQSAPQFDITLMMAELDGELVGSWQFSPDLFETKTIRRLAGHFETLLADILARPSQPISELNLLTKTEQRQLVEEWNETIAEFPSDLCLHQLFEHQAAQTPDALALVYEEQQVSYAELNRRANQLAHHLQAHGVGAESRVALLLERSVEMVVAVLGVLKAGGAYVPLDPAYPAERLSYMQADAGVRFVLAQQQLVERVPTALQAVCLDNDWEVIKKQSGQNVRGDVQAENLAYALYTSGSTGRPKGVLVTHRSLVNYLHWAIKSYSVADGQGTLLHSSLSFDLTITSLFPSLLTGRTVRLLGDGHEIEQLSNALRTHQDLSLVKITPSHLEALSRLLPAQEAAGRTRAFIIGGEALLGESLRFWKTHAGATRLVNEYGPTEAVVGCCVYDVPDDAAALSGSVPIGRAISNAQLYVLDEHLQPVPIGVPGELYIGGVCLARGYLNHPDLTAERFIPNPFAPSTGARLYRTGDVACHLPDGNLRYLGRRDGQVKVRGYRIELGEVEAVAMRHPSVRQAALVCLESAAGDKRLAAYIVCEKQSHNGAAGAGELRRFMEQQLPSYMVPSDFVLLEEMPLTTNGKVNRQALPVPAERKSENGNGYVAPRTPVEEVTAGIWAEVLSVAPVGIHDNFFERGGHSLLATQVISRMRDALQVEVPLAKFFEQPTVAGLSEFVIENCAVPQESRSPLVSSIKRRDAQQPLVNLDSLSDEQVGVLLNNMLAASEPATE